MLRLEGVVVRFGQLEALAGVDLQVADGERLSVLGPSGSGKSTLLRAVAGLETPVAGRITWDGDDLARVAAHRRGFGLMFQDYVLFPHRDVAGNVAFGLQMRGDRRPAVEARVAEVLDMVGLRGYGKRPVTALSGGEQQRVALARALAPAPRVLMLDEPLGALDRTLRQRLLYELSDLFSSLALTILYVTHDQDEALALGDRVAVMRAGRIEAVMPPTELWRSPPSEFVARFLGLDNITDALVDEHGRAHTAWAVLPLRSPPRAGTTVRLLIRPEGIRPARHGSLRATLEAQTFHGDRIVLRLALPGAPPLEARTDVLDLPPVGDELRFEIEPEAIVRLP